MGNKSGGAASAGEKIPSAHKALLVGINYVGSEYTLKTGPEIVKKCHSFLTRRGFDADFKVLTDEAGQEMPTRSAIMESLRWLVEDAQPSHSLFFLFVGHVMHIKKRDNTLIDSLVPWDWDQTPAGLISRDTITEVLSKVPKGAHLTVVCDTNHGGNLVRLPWRSAMKGGEIAWTKSPDAHTMNCGDIVQFCTSTPERTAPASGALANALMELLDRTPTVPYTDLLRKLQQLLQKRIGSGVQVVQIETSRPLADDEVYSLGGFPVVDVGTNVEVTRSESTLLGQRGSVVGIRDDGQAVAVDVPGSGRAVVRVDDVKVLPSSSRTPSAVRPADSVERVQVQSTRRNSAEPVFGDFHVGRAEMDNIWEVRLRKEAGGALGLHLDPSTLVLTDVEHSGQAAKAAHFIGRRLTHINHTPVFTLQEVTSLALPDDSPLLTFEEVASPRASPQRTNEVAHRTQTRTMTTTSPATSFLPSPSPAPLRHTASTYMTTAATHSGHSSVRDQVFSSTSPPTSPPMNLWNDPIPPPHEPRKSPPPARPPHSPALHHSEQAEPSRPPPAQENHPNVYSPPLVGPDQYRPLALPGANPVVTENISYLMEKKKEAVAAEDYMEAKRLKQEIDYLTAKYGSTMPPPPPHASAYEAMNQRVQSLEKRLAETEAALAARDKELKAALSPRPVYYPPGTPSYTSPNAYSHTPPQPPPQSSDVFSSPTDNYPTSPPQQHLNYIPPPEKARGILRANDALPHRVFSGYRYGATSPPRPARTLRPLV